jgi:DNA-binding NarL/FixJ family response regulator
MITVFIVADEDDTLAYITACIDAQPDMQVSGSASSFSETMGKLTPDDLLLVSTNLPNDEAYHLVLAVAREDMCLRVMVVGHGESVEDVIRYFEAGARGYVCRNADYQEIVENIRCIQRGEAMFPPRMGAALLARLVELSFILDEMRPQNEIEAVLTRREREILWLIGRDYTNQDIANILIIEVGTVKNHVHNILSKLNVRSRREAASFVGMLRENPRAKKRHFERNATGTLYP